MLKKTVKILVVAVMLTFCIGGKLGSATEEKIINEKTIDSVKHSKPASFYTVQEGDNLSEIAEKTGVTLTSLIRTNRLSSSKIYPRQVLLIPGRSPDFNIAISRGYTREDIMLLARAIHAEARGESFTGQVAVGAVILNRLKNDSFPKTIREIIMQNGNGTYQFSPVGDGSIGLDPDNVAICAAIQAIEGFDPSNGALYFYNPEIATDQWIRTLPVLARIGNHVFASKI